MYIDENKESKISQKKLLYGQQQEKGVTDIYITQLCVSANEIAEQLTYKEKRFI